MKDKIIVAAGLIWLVLSIFSWSASANSGDTIFQEVSAVKRWVDVEMDVACWARRGSSEWALSCLPISQLSEKGQAKAQEEIERQQQADEDERAKTRGIGSRRDHYAK